MVSHIFFQPLLQKVDIFQEVTSLLYRRPGLSEDEVPVKLINNVKVMKNCQHLLVKPLSGTNRSEETLKKQIRAGLHSHIQQSSQEPASSKFWDFINLTWLPSLSAAYLIFHQLKLVMNIPALHFNEYGIWIHYICRLSKTE